MDAFERNRIVERRQAGGVGGVEGHREESVLPILIHYERRIRIKEADLVTRGGRGDHTRLFEDVKIRVGW